MEIRRLMNIGNTFYACLPQHWVSSLNLTKHDYVILSRVEGGILIEPLKASLLKKKLDKEKEAAL